MGVSGSIISHGGSTLIADSQGVMCFLPVDWFLCYLDPGKGSEAY